MSLALSELLNIRKGLTVLVGSGGKSALLARVARELPGTVLVCSTYYYYPYRDMSFLSLSDITPSAECAMLAKLLNESRLVCAGEMVGNGKLGQPVSSFSELKKLADYVLVEADDARGFPLKAHAAHEPRLPEEEDIDDAICVFGASGFMRPITEAVHHADVFQLITGCAEDAPAKPELVARAFLNERLARHVFINQVETKELLARAEQFVNATDVKNIVVGSIQKNAYKRYL